MKENMYLCFRFKSEFEKELLTEIKSCSTRMSKASLDHTAYLRGMSELYNVNIDKHRQQVLSELTEDEKKDIRKDEGVGKSGKIYGLATNVILQFNVSVNHNNNSILDF